MFILSKPKHIALPLTCCHIQKESGLPLRMSYPTHGIPCPGYKCTLWYICETNSNQILFMHVCILQRHFEIMNKKAFVEFIFLLHFLLILGERATCK